MLLKKWFIFQWFNNFLWLLWLNRARVSTHNWVKNCIDLDWRETLLGGWGPQKGVEKLKDRQKKIENSPKKVPSAHSFGHVLAKNHTIFMGSYLWKIRGLYTWGGGFAVCETTWFFAKPRDKSTLEKWQLHVATYSIPRGFNSSTRVTDLMGFIPPGFNQKQNYAYWTKKI